MTFPSLNDPPILDKIHELIKMVDPDCEEYEGELATQLIQTALRLLIDKTDLGQMKLMTRALKEMRYAYKIFRQYPGVRIVSIFGSARTPSNHPDYLAARDFSDEMSLAGWTCMTGAAEGIMKAGLEGAKPENRFGLSIKLPWEAAENPLFDNDKKLIMFRYFFTRKLMFVSHSDAFAAFPGGYGTMDELFEVLTLMQTGKAELMPVVLMEGIEGSYWNYWQSYVQEHLLDKGLISPEDKSLYFIAKNGEVARDHIVQFYSNYHSSRYVNEYLVIRLEKAPKQENLDQLSEVFKDLIVEGKIEISSPFPEERDFREKHRVAFIHTRKDYGRLRQLIDALNLMF